MAPVAKPAAGVACDGRRARAVAAVVDQAARPCLRRPVAGAVVELGLPWCSCRARGPRRPAALVPGELPAVVVAVPAAPRGRRRGRAGAAWCSAPWVLELPQWAVVAVQGRGWPQPWTAQRRRPRGHVERHGGQPDHRGQIAELHGRGLIDDDRCGQLGQARSPVATASASTAPGRRSIWPHKFAWRNMYEPIQSWELHVGARIIKRIRR
jgi:hypothetical protein